MSSVNGAGDGTAYFQQMQKNFSQLEEDLQSQKKEQRKRADEEIADIEARYRKGMERARADMERTIENNRDSSRETMARQREVFREQARESRDQLYDRLGRQARQEQQENNKHMSRAVQENERLSEQARQTVERTESRASEKLRQATEAQGRQLTDALQKHSDSAEESLSAALANQKSLGEDFRRETTRRMEDMRERQNSDRQFIEKAAVRGVDDAMKAARKMVQETEKHHEEKARILDQKRSLASLGEAQSMSSSRNRETAELREKIEAVNEIARDLPRRFAEKTREMVRYDDDTRRQREQSIVQAYEDQIHRLKGTAEVRESSLVDGNQAQLREQSEQVRARIDHQNVEHAERLNEMRREFDITRDSMERDRKYDKKLNDLRFEKVTERLTRDRGQGLVQQAEAYEVTIDRNHRVAKDEKEVLQRRIQVLVDPERVENISPAAERTIRAQYEKEGQKKLAAEQLRNQRALEEQQIAARDNLSNVLIERDRDLAEFQRQATTDRYLDRNTFGKLVEEITEDSQSKLTRQDEQFQRQAMMQGKANAQNLERLKYGLEDSMRDREELAELKVREVRENAQHNLRLQLREHASRTAEMIRQYEKRINELRTTHQDEVLSLKDGREKEVREVEKRLKNQLDEQARTYEHRIAALEQQNDERAKVIARNYEDQLDRVRNANEQILRRRKLT